MSAQDDTAFLRQVKQHLDQHADDIDELTLARLRSMRKTALDRSTRGKRRWLPVTGFATAAAALLAVLIWQQGLNHSSLSAGDWELLASGEELELIEDWEFYAWLEEVQSNS